MKDKHKLKEAIEKLVEYLDEERCDFADNPSPDHIYNAVQLLINWLANETND